MDEVERRTRPKIMILFLSNLLERRPAGKSRNIRVTANEETTKPTRVYETWKLSAYVGRMGATILRPSRIRKVTSDRLSTTTTLPSYCEFGVYVLEGSSSSGKIIDGP